MTGFLDTVAAGAATVYDIGANWGYFGAALVTNPTFEGHVHAFEIAPRTFRDLTKLVTQCRLTERITCHRFGLSERRGTVRILEGRHSALTQVSDDATSGIEARVEALDTLDLPAPDIIKLDVEGHEASVLKGGSALLARARPLIVFESWYSAHQPESMLVPISFLETLGYDFYRLAWGTTLGGRPAYVIDCPAGEGATATLMMRKLSPAERPLIPVALNIVAVPVDRPERLGPSWTAS